MGASDITLALVGCGRWGSNILRDLRSLGVRVLAVDPSAERRQIALAGGANAAFEGLAHLPAVDGFVVASPATTHADVVGRSLSFGRPVFAEKPLTTDVESARRLVRESEDRLFVMHNWRYHPGIERLGEIARADALGAVHGLRTTRTNWTSPRTDTDVFFTLLPHDLSIAQAILGVIPEPRFAHAEQLGARAVSVSAVLQGPAWLIVEASNRYAEKRREVRLHCELGVAVLAHGEADHVTIARADPRNVSTPLLERVPVDTTPPVLRELEAFVAHVQGGPPPKTTAAEGLAVVEGVSALRALAGLEDPA